MTKQIGVRAYVRTKNGVTWNTVYKKFGVKKVNAAIRKGSIYSGMSGEARALS